MSIPNQEKMEQKICKTLIVDDDDRFRRWIRELLATEVGIEVIGEAADGLEAIRKAREFKPDLILMDIRMPGMDGIKVTRQLKDEMPVLTIIILTSFDLEIYRKAALVSGASDYVTKRTMVERLIPAIREATNFRYTTELKILRK